MAAHASGHPHPIPQAVDVRTSKAGLRTVATFEASKGIVVLVLGILLVIVHSHVQDLAESLLYHLHIDFDRRLSHMLLDAATRVTDARMLTISIAAGTYSAVRFVEAWGLWNQRVWAEWFALLSGALYLPWEILKLVERIDWERAGVLITNIIIIAYMLYIRIRDCRGNILDCEETPVAVSAAEKGA